MDDYQDTSGIVTKVATLAGVDESLVSVSVAAASVIITVTIAVPASTTSAAVESALSSSLGTAADASSQLGITVETAPTIDTAPSLTTETESAISAGDDAEGGSPPLGLVIGLSVGALAVALGLLWRGRAWWRKRSQPVVMAHKGGVVQTDPPPPATATIDVTSTTRDVTVELG